MRCAGAAVVLFCLAGAEAEATYSIVGADRSTGQVGGAGASCLGGNFSVYVIYGSAPGKGAVHAQAQLNRQGRDEAVRMLDGGASPAEVIARISSPSFDPNAAVRQYGVVDVAGRAAGFTGTSTLSYAGDVQGLAGGRFAYSAQGNILTSRRVLDQAKEAFEQRGCDLAEKLLLALEAGADGGEGDSRCTSRGIPSDSAFLQVDRPGEPAGSHLRIEVPYSGNQSPLVELRRRFDMWRASNPCPVDAGVDAGAEVDAGVDGGGSFGPDAGTDAGTSSSVDGGEDRTDGATGSCGCSTVPPGLMLALALLAIRRRVIASPG